MAIPADRTATPVVDTAARGRWCQFRLKSLILFVLVASLPFAWLAHERDRRQGRRAAVRVFKKLGANLRFHDDGAPRQRPPTGALRAGKLRDEESLPEVREVWFYHGARGVTDATLVHLAYLDRIECLGLAGSEITDAGLAKIGKLKNLSELDLAGTRVTDEGLRQIVKLKALSRLSLAATAISDAGLSDIARLRNLKCLFVNGTRVSEAGIADLRKVLPSLVVVR